MKKIFYTLLIVVCSLKLSAQGKIFNKIFSDDTTRRNSFLPIPVVGFSQEAGVSLGVAGIYAFYTDLNNPNIKASQATGVVAFSTKKRVQISFKADVWASENKFHYLVDARYTKQPFNLYGIGNQTLLADEDDVDFGRLRLNAELEREVAKNFYLGGGLEYENLKFENKGDVGIYSTSPAFIDKDGGQFAFIKATSFFDSRDNVPYPSKGFYAKLQYGFSPDFFGPDDYSGSLITADLRNFYKLNKAFNLALNATYEGLISNKTVPFYMLRQLGNDQFMRAYYSGRFRDENLITSQAELRFRPIPRLGLVAFGGAGKVFGKNNFSQTSFKPTYGIGGRFFFDLEKGLALRLDYAMGEKPTGEKRISGFYISLGEAF